MKMKERADLQQVVTDQVIASIESGEVLPWHCPWLKSIPYNWCTQQSYSGINILILWMAAMSNHYAIDAWLTFKQAAELGGVVKRGEKSVHCFYFKTYEVNDKECDEDKKRIVIYRNSFCLFNVAQVDGLENLPLSSEQKKYDDQETVEAINHIAETYCASSGVQIKHGGNSAYYSPTKDMIFLPTTFFTGSDYAATLAHELVHSTGHHTRLNRLMGSMSKNSSSYAYEELVAELGAAFISAELGIQGQHAKHVSYLDSWLTLLKRDKTFLFKAAGAAARAHNFLIREQSDPSLVASNGCLDRQEVLV